MEHPSLDELYAANSSRNFSMCSKPTFTSSSPRSHPINFLQADLEAFRARHFRDVPEPHAAVKAAAHESTYEDDDGLGYYPDGVKRTLTDEQIAMFRHSEIYALVRERQIKKENEDAESSEGPIAVKSQPDAVAVAQDIPKENMNSNDNSDDEAEYAAFLKAEQKQFRDQAASSKRKRAAPNFAQERNRDHSTRRITREMDSVGADETVLDYGDEPKEQHSHRDLDDLDGRKRIKFDDTESSPAAPAKPAIEGRKIWWPTIGG